MKNAERNDNEINCIFNLNLIQTAENLYQFNY